MNTLARSVLALAAAGFAAQAAADITVYTRENYRGRNFTTDDRRVEVSGERGASVEITDRRTWEVCEAAEFRGRCVRLSPGNYPTLASMGLQSRISSFRAVDWDPNAGDGRDYRRRGGERLYEADVVSVRAVMGADEQRCWVEREQVGSRPGAGGAIAGAVIGGILGHQLGHGSNRTGATVGGAVVGGAVGGSVDSRPAYQDVQRCTTAPSSQAPAFWDVTYMFRGQEHRVQLNSPPGARITVNQYGEPRA